MERDIRFMQRALELAKQGEGFVEPNPMVGCVITQGDRIVGEGFHRRYGGPHAEIEAIRAAGELSVGGTCYVTLEPCAHHGKTPPCTAELLRSGIRRIVVAMRDPNPIVNGRGLELLRNAKLEITERVLESEARKLNAPFIMRYEKKRPWIVAKWAMTLDGKLASRTGSSQWISSEESRRIVHQLRGRMDAVMVGSQTVLQDDALLTVRIDSDREDATLSSLPDETNLKRFADPVGPRKPLRIILDSKGKISLESRMIRTAKEVPVLVVVDPDVSKEKLDELEDAGCEILQLSQRVPPEEKFAERNRQRDQRSGTTQNGEIRNGSTRKSNFHDRPENGLASQAELVWKERLSSLFGYLLQRNVNQLLVEGGSKLFGTLFDMRAIDEVHAFIAPKLIGGDQAVPVFGGVGLPDMGFAGRLESPQIRIVGEDVYIHGRVQYPE